MKKILLNGRTVQTLLNGFLCVYKPRDVSISHLKKQIINAICTESNELDEIIVPEIKVPIVEPHSRSQALVVVGEKKQLDYVFHPLMSGKMFRTEDIEMKPLNYLKPSSSGVCLFGVNDGCTELKNIKDCAWINDYYLHGEFGIEKSKHEIRGKTTAKAKYDHITLNNIKKLISKIKFQYKRLSFEFANFDLQSQEAFEIARKGAPRPKILGSPIVYNIELKYFKLPYFTLLLQLTGENDYFLRAFLHEIGCGLESLACPRKVRRIREGPFTLDHALIEKHLQLIPILKNIQMCNKIVEMTLKKKSDVIEVKKKNDTETDSLISLYNVKNELNELQEPKDCIHFTWNRNYE